jgi:hypothetical protein
MASAGAGGGKSAGAPKDIPPVGFQKRKGRLMRHPFLERRQGKQLKQGAMGLVWRQETGRRERSEGADASDTDHICRDAPHFWRDEDFLRHLVSGQLSADQNPHADFFRPDALSPFQTDADAPKVVRV